MTTLESVTTTPAPARMTARPTVDYDTYVLSYTRAQRNNVLLSFAGVAAIVGAGMYTTGAAMVILIALGLGLAGGGLAAVGIAAGAHTSYTRHFGRTEVTQYQEPPQPVAVRAFVPSQNGTATIRAGRFRLTRQQWTRLFQSADNGRLTRDGSMKILPRELYRNWADTLGDLARLGIVDAGGIITDEGWRFYNENVGIPPYPNDGEAIRAGNSTHARRTHDAHDAGMSS